MCLHAGSHAGCARIFHQRQTETDTDAAPSRLASAAERGLRPRSRDRVPGCSPLALVPAALRDGGQLRGVPVAVQVLGGAPGHDPLQPSVVGFAALGGGVVRQTQGHALAPEQELAVGDLKAKPSSATAGLPHKHILNDCFPSWVAVNGSPFTGREVNRLEKLNPLLSAQPESHQLLS